MLTSNSTTVHTLNLQQPLTYLQIKQTVILQHQDLHNTRNTSQTRHDKTINEKIPSNNDNNKKIIFLPNTLQICFILVRWPPHLKHSVSVYLCVNELLIHHTIYV